MWLDQKTFAEVTKNTPLVSIDLIITDGNSRYLLGKRINKPAQGLWFVPGGRILKNQTLQQAFEAVTVRELGFQGTFSSARLRGVYEHFYDDNFFDRSDFGTHYVVLAYEFVMPEATFANLPLDQHERWAFFTAAEILSARDIHPSSKGFFK